MLRSKFIGCLVGSALGDSLGSSFEGLSIFEAKVKPEHYSGHWTDDTHMMIGMAESLIENEGFNGSHMAQTFIRNYENEPWRGYAFGPPQVFSWIRSGVAWNEAAKRLFGGEGSYGNGAAMRVAPIGLLYNDDLEQLRAVAYSSSEITHSHVLGREGAALQACAVAMALKEDPTYKLDVYTFLENLKNFTLNDVYRERLMRLERLLGGTSKRNVVRELGNGVEAHNSVPTAIYCFLRNSGSFKEALGYAINLGGDTDTIGAMTGAISGAYHGAEAIPKGFKRQLELGEYIETLAEKLWQIKISSLAS